MLSLLGYNTEKVKIPKFEESIDFDTRKHVAEKLIRNYPERIPVIINSDNLVLTKVKYLVPKDLTFSRFIIQIRKNCTIKPEQGIYLFTESSTLPCPSECMINIYNKHKNKDEFLYFSCTQESTFGLSVD